MHWWPGSVSFLRFSCSRSSGIWMLEKIWSKWDGDISFQGIQSTQLEFYSDIMLFHLQDYVLFIPESVYSPMVVMRDPTSRVSEFAKECSKDNFYIKPTIKGFCRDGTFSLTTAFNNGTLACGCDKQGAADQNCEELGGQCRCRSPYITGRTCNRCRMGYFGFPNCQGILQNFMFDIF